MGEPFDMNLMIKMQVTINNNALLIKQLSEFLKLAKIVVVLVLGFVGFLEDEHSFSTLVSTKDKLCNKLGLTLDMIVQMFAQDFFIHKEFFLSRSTHNMEGLQSANQCYHLKGLVSFWPCVSISTI